ncbi:hypothetical protein tb265_07640 [Gemmatimonadetes bacterium T265]|nr:hypothetical protein tb265_07640 [Gemmatimonadetes bacterium T265]
MTDRRHGTAQRVATGEAAERARVREAQHATLADLLGAYADGELPAESAARIEAHLVGCVRCRRDLATQTALRDRLAAAPVLPAPTALRDRIIASTAAVPPAPELLAAPPATPTDGVRAPRPGRRWRAVLASAALVAAAMGGGAAVWRGRPAADDAGVPSQPAPVASVPLLAAALADYRRSTAGDLPGRARDLDALRAAVGFPVEPLRAPGFRLLAAWTTTLDGEPAAVLTYRWRDRLVVQYRVSEALFFRYAALRSAAAAHQPLSAVDGAQGVVAWPEATSGVVLVSDDTPARLLASVRALPFAAPPADPAPTAAP